MGLLRNRRSYFVHPWIKAVLKRSLEREWARRGVGIGRFGSGIVRNVRIGFGVVNGACGEGRDGEERWVFGEGEKGATEAACCCRESRSHVLNTGVEKKDEGFERVLALGFFHKQKGRSLLDGVAHL